MAIFVTIPEVECVRFKTLQEITGIFFVLLTVYLITCIPRDHLHRVTYTGDRIDTIDSPDDEHLFARNM
jgi:hypothetical protein